MDANLLSGTGYYVGLADYGSSRWQWHGPFADNQVRISTARQGPFTSSLGNLFVSVLVSGGSAADVVCIEVNEEDGADTMAPPQPAGLAAQPISAGLLLSWSPVNSGDLAGYRIYHSDDSFSAGNAAGVQMLDKLAVDPQHSLPAASGKFIRVSAVDISGNESPLSEIIAADPLDGDAPLLQLSVDRPSGLPDEGITLTASGAKSYDFDLDGDGIFEITGNTSGSVQMDTSRPGILRPRVRATGIEGTAVALGSISLIITSNSRPVAVAITDLASGFAPLDISFSGSTSTDFDGSIVGGGWDFDDDGTYDVWDDTDIVHVTSAFHTYTSPGLYNARLRVLDDQGSWDTDRVAIRVEQLTNLLPVAILRGSDAEGDTPLEVVFSAIDSYDPDGSIVDYEWDFDGNGVFNEAGPESDSHGNALPDAQTFSEGPPLQVSLRVTDNLTASQTATFTVNVHGFATGVVDAAGSASSISSLEIVDGRPAISYYIAGNQDLMYARAQDEYGTSWGSPIVVDSSGDSGSYNSLAVVDGYPAISYLNATNLDLMYVRALDAAGDSWGTPVLVVGITTEDGLQPCLAVVNGNPAISFHTVTWSVLRYVRATDATGSAWGSPLIVETDYEAGQFNSLVVVNGRPAISYDDLDNQDLRYVRALDANGDSWGAPQTLDSTGNVGYYNSLAVVDGHPAISYHDVTNGDLKYLRALDADGTSWGSPQVLDAAGLVGSYYTSLKVISGKPAISYHDQTNGYLKFIQALDVTGTNWDTPLVLDNSALVGRYSSMEELDGYAAISYLDLSNAELKFGVWYKGYAIRTGYPE